ncbi:MAG: DUF1905 domain-containing protein [Pseudolysinimonas sp.]|uniref:DUF1905 domain-containing protein n=1 Tax=Pseudolysinimonas sp. TaxID=2680009 RepID=UPI0032642557
MRFEFDAEVWRWEARVDSWAFLSVPQDASDETREYIGAGAQELGRRGFGAVRVEVMIGETTWRTSIFPGHSGAPYSLPLKKAVRKAESLDIGDPVHVMLEILD